MNKKLKKSISAFFAAAMIVSSVGCISVSANNCKDTYKTYKVGGYNYTWTEGARVKTDYTSSYQKCIKTGATYQSWVYGSNVNNIPVSTNNLHSGKIKYRLKNPKTGKATPTYHFRNGTVHYMINYVKENKLKYAGMMFYTGAFHGTNATIKWSPDSV